MRNLIIILILFFTSYQVRANSIQVAVASNFLNTLEILTNKYKENNDLEILISNGSTGKLYAQIVNGAPYDLFFAADSKRPKLLEEKGHGVKGSRFTYALGRLALWSPFEKELQKRLPYFTPEEINFIAIANPMLAPYGKAAMETLMALGVWDNLQNQLVRGENINQTLNYVLSGNAKIGLVAFSQIIKIGMEENNSYWIVPENMHSKIKQQAVLIEDKVIAHEFMAFIKSAIGKNIISKNGYVVPEH